MVNKNVKCIPVKAKKPEKIWVTEGHYRSGKKWCWIGRGFKESVPSAKTMLSFCRSEYPKIKYRLREYTAGKVLKG